MRILLFIMASIIVMTGCMNNEQLGSQHELDPKPVRLSTEDNREIVIDRRPSDDYIESDEEGVGQYGSERNIFNSREERQISQQLAKRKEIMQSRVAITPNRVVVFASLSEYPNDITKSIEEDVKRFVPDRDVVVFTDEAQWERMKHLDASLKQREIGEDLEEFLEEYFNIDIKD